MEMSRYELDVKNFIIEDVTNPLGDITRESVNKYLASRARRGNKIVQFIGKLDGRVYRVQVLWDTSTDMDEETAVRLGLIEAAD